MGISLKDIYQYLSGGLTKPTTEDDYGNAQVYNTPVERQAAIDSARPRVRAQAPAAQMPGLNMPVDNPEPDFGPQPEATSLGPGAPITLPGSNVDVQGPSKLHPVNPSFRDATYGNPAALTTKGKILGALVNAAVGAAAGAGSYSMGEGLQRGMAIPAQARAQFLAQQHQKNQDLIARDNAMRMAGVSDAQTAHLKAETGAIPTAIKANQALIDERNAQARLANTRAGQIAKGKPEKQLLPEQDEQATIADLMQQRSQERDPSKQADLDQAISAHQAILKAIRRPTGPPVTLQMNQVKREDETRINSEVASFDDIARSNLAKAGIAKPTYEQLRDEYEKQINTAVLKAKAEHGEDSKEFKQLAFDAYQLKLRYQKDNPNKPASQAIPPFSLNLNNPPEAPAN